MMTTSAMPAFGRLFDCLVDDHVGVINSVSEIRTEAGGPQFFHFSAQLCNTLAIRGYPNCGRTSAAAARRDVAVINAVTDAVSSYCATLRSEEKDKRPVTSANSASFSCVPPCDFALFSNQQYREPGFPWVPFDEDTPVHWAPTLDLQRGEVMFVPSAMIFLPYAPLAQRGEAPIVPHTSTGLACHWNPARAALEAICDVIECDALALFWQCRLVLPHLRIETLSDTNYDLVARFERCGSSVNLLKVELDLGVPTFVAVLTNSSPLSPARVFAAGTGLDPEQAIRKCLENLAHVHYYCQLIQTHWRRRSQDPNDVLIHSDHLNYWCDHRNAGLINFLLSSPDRLEFDNLKRLAVGDPQKDLAALLRRIQSNGYRILLADITSPDIKTMGLSVLRAVIPGLHPLFFGFRTRALGGSRLWQLAGELGHNGVTRESGDSPLPHPFSRKGIVS